ncbi:MAG TPA: hypothetical protein VFA18_21645 [Gemmataceae bacterium]|nr:hypothetical protein [Gemmataceae bacterium]
MPTPHRLIALYEQGLVTQAELFLSLALEVTEENVTGLISAAPAALLEKLRAYLDGCPRTEEDWVQLRMFVIRTWAPGTSVEQIQDALAEERSLHRRGVELLQATLGG